jgi:hypothetical protein
MDKFHCSQITKYKVQIFNDPSIFWLHAENQVIEIWRFLFLFYFSCFWWLKNFQNHLTFQIYKFRISEEK